MPLVATDAMLNRRTNSAGTLFSPVATGAPIKWGQQQAHRSTGSEKPCSPQPGDQPHTSSGRNHRPGPPELALVQIRVARYR
jgi:hypothetical protein